MVMIYGEFGISIDLCPNDVSFFYYQYIGNIYKLSVNFQLIDYKVKLIISNETQVENVWLFIWFLPKFVIIAWL